MEISVVSPVFKAENIVSEFVNRTRCAISEVTEAFEIILVDDGSPDGVWKKINEWCQKDNRIKGIQLSRNFGQHQAIIAGLTYSTGNYVVVLDCDLQHDPKYIPKLYQKILSGFDIVYARIRSRRYSLFKNVMAISFYRVFSWISGSKIDPLMLGCYSILSRKVVNSFLQLKEYKCFYRHALQWLGYRESFVEVKHCDRYSGKSSYSLMMLIKHAMTLTISYSDKLLRISIYIGILFSGSAFAGILYILYQYLFVGVLAGWTSIMVMIALVGGLVMLSLGILGLYIGQVFEQVKNRPRFLVQKSVNLGDVI